MVINRLKNKKVLITYGSTWIPLDQVRVLSNRSSGKLGQLLTTQFKKEGARITLLEGPVEKPFLSKGVRVVRFKFYDELLALLKQELDKKYDIILHAAAVADYQINKVLVN